MGDQHDAGAVMHVAVVRDVDQQLIERALLDPAVIQRDEIVQRERFRPLGRYLDAEPVQVHGAVQTVAGVPVGFGGSAAWRCSSRRALQACAASM